MTAEQIHNEELYEACRKYFEKFQKKIDEHLNNIEEFCQKTMINKKGIPNQTNSKRKTANRKKINWKFVFFQKFSSLLAGTGTTKRLTKGTPSCVKRQTPKAALKNVSRPRNRFAHEKNPQLPLTTKPNPPKENNKIQDIQNLFPNDYLKSANVSQFALALVQALRQVGQSAKMYEIYQMNIIN